MSLLRKLAFVLALVPLLPAQVFKPTLGIAEQQYREAQEAWLREDPNLAADLLTGNPAEMHKRIRRIASLRDDVMDKKVVYLDLVVKRFGEIRGRIEGAAQTQLPVGDLKKELQDEQSRLLEDQERIESLIQDLPQGDDYALVMRELTAEKDELVKLQNAIAMRMRSLDQIDKNQEASREVEAKDPLAKKLDAITAMWTEERDKAKAQRSKWADLYAAMDSEVDRGKSRAQPAKKPAVPPANSQPVKPDKSKPATPAQTPQARSIPAQGPGFQGSWLYQSSPGAWTGFGEPVQVSLSLRQSGTRLEGEYRARIPGRNILGQSGADGSDIRKLDLALTGDETAPGLAKVSWVSQMPPSKGEMLLHLGGDRRVLVERIAAGDTYFPRGMEILLPAPNPSGR